MPTRLAGILKVLGFYWFVYLLLFLQFPLAGSLPGDLDTWANLAMYKDVGNHICSLFSGTTLGQSNYPCTHVWVNFGLDFFLGIGFLFFKALNFNDLWSYYLFITSVLSLNSYALFKLSKSYNLTWQFSILPGLFFCLSNFVLGNIDNPNIIWVFPGVLACYYLKHKSHNLSLAFSIALMGLQFFVAPVTIPFFVIIYLLIALFRLPDVLAKFLANPPAVLLAVLVCIVIVSPYVYYYLVIKVNAENMNVIKEMAQVKDISLNLNDLFHVLPNNLLYDYTDKYNYPWLSLIKSAFLGFSTIILIGIILIKCASKYKELFVAMLIGLVLSLGPYIVYNSSILFKSPLYPLYTLHFVQDFFRIPARAFLMVCLAASIVIAAALSLMMKSPSKMVHVMAVVIFVFWFFENLPMPFMKYNSAKVLNYNQGYTTVLKSDGLMNVADLPSGLFDYKGDRREYWYMYWQTLHRQNSINGAMSYLPYERLRNDTLCKNITVADNLSKLIAVNKLDYIVFHRNLCYGNEALQKEVMDSSRRLYAVYDKDSVIVYKVKK